MHRFAVSFLTVALGCIVTSFKSIGYDLVQFGTKDALTVTADSIARHRQRRPEASKNVKTGF